MQITCAPKHTAQTGLSIYLSVSLCLSLSLPLFVSLSLSLSVVGKSGYAELWCVSVCVCVCVFQTLQETGARVGAGHISRGRHARACADLPLTPALGGAGRYPCALCPHLWGQDGHGKGETLQEGLPLTAGLYRLILPLLWLL